MYSFQKTVRMEHTDAGERLFFINVLKFCHETYENFLESINIPIDKALKTKKVLLPLVHAESDFKQLIFISERITVELVISKIGNSSFEVSYTLKKVNGDICATAKTVHVSVDRDNRKIPLPEELKDKFSLHLAQY